jgi:putative hemolysin
MQKIDLQLILLDKAPFLFKKFPSFISIFVLFLFEKLLKIKLINSFIERNRHLKGIDFINSLFDELNFTYNVSDKSKNRIPAEGKVIIVSNHPLGGLDGLALLKAVYEVRQDVKIVANDILANIENLKDLFLPFDLFNPIGQKVNIKNIELALTNDEAVIFFPSGEVSRLTFKGIRDGKWKKGALHFAKSTKAPILPAFIKGRNSVLFYALSFIWKPIGMFLLPRELFKQKNKTITIKFGDLIPPESFEKVADQKLQINLLKKHTYRIGKGKSGIYKTEKTIIHPVSAKLLKSDLLKSDLLGQTYDGKKIYVCKKDTAPNIMREISRLREITFRKVGEGTGKSADTDIYDNYYHHIVLWDEDALEIIGSYRLGVTKEIIAQYGVEGLYNSSQFFIHPEFNEVLTQSIELGRSFIQQRYWRSNALDYIWQGIGAFIKKNPDIRYLWGAVSISNSYSEFAKVLIVYYYKKWYQGNEKYATPMTPFVISKLQEEEASAILNGSSYEEDFRILKNTLKTMGYSVPILYKRYTELCNYGGAKFISFSVDESFMNAIDGLILVDLYDLKDEYKERYYQMKSFVNA